MVCGEHRAAVPEFLASQDSRPSVPSSNGAQSPGKNHSGLPPPPKQPYDAEFQVSRHTEGKGVARCTGAGRIEVVYLSVSVAVCVLVCACEPHTAHGIT